MTEEASSSIAPSHAGWMVNVMSISDIPAMLSGVYFLLEGNEVVYVGQAISVLRRVAEHLADPSKKFDRFSWINIDPGLLNVTEQFYISKLVPRYNSCSLSRAARSAAAKMPPAGDKAVHVQPLPHEEQPKRPEHRSDGKTVVNLMTTEEASAYTGVSAGTLAGWRYNKKGPPFVKLGGKILYRQREVDEWIDACLHVTAPQVLAS